MSNGLKKILVVDDEKQVLEYLSHILKRANYEVIATTKGKEVIDLASKSKPDLIILDIVLTDMDGSDVASSLSSDPFTAKIPILFLTGILKKKEESFVEKTGKSYVIAKPVTAPELLKMVNKILAG
ncbi:MAG: response regulator [Candidatus Omnitrophota bacterium]|nr:MAG: response regulator [Candidatus Omnitrophota bacterium]